VDRTAVMEKLEPIIGLAARNVDHGPNTRIVVTPEMVTLRPGSGQRSLEITEDGVCAMANFAGIPVSLGQQLSANTFSRVANELLERKRQYTILVKDRQVVDFTRREHFHNINASRVLDIVERVIPGAEYHRALVMEKQTVQLEIVGEDNQAVARNDLVRAGALITFSPINITTPSVQSFVVRLICTNGATSNQVLREFEYGGDGDGLWQFFRRSIRDAYRSLIPIVERWRQMREEEIAPEDRAMVLEALIKQAGIPKELADAVRAQALAHPPTNAYAMSNLITWASSHLLAEPRQVQRAQKAAARFDDESEHQRMCPVCHRTR